MGIGLGLMGGVAGTVGNMTSDAVNQTDTQESNDMQSFRRNLEKLMLMKEMGALSQEESNIEKKRLLAEL